MEKQLEKEILKLYHANNEKQIEEVLKSDLKIPLHKFANQKQFTVKRNLKVLHLACLHNSTMLAQLTLSYCKNSNILTRAELEQFINLQNKDGFTPLHMASFKGNLEIIKLLLQEGASKDARNATGLTVLHMSVQGDHVKASRFWINNGIPIDIQDSVNQTPLICAAFLGSQQIVNFLIPWGAQLNIQTKDKGYSALHVATIQGHSRIVRKLLIKGIDRRLRDKHGKTALDLAIESRFTSIQEMIENKMGLAERCGLRQPHSKVKQNYKSLLFYLTLYCTSFLFTVIFSFPFMDSLQIWYLIIFSLTLLLTYILTKKNPGFLPLTNKPLMDLLESNSADQICPECSILKPARSRHCEICEKCVSRYDHHCPWLCTCIGERNLYVFITFLFLLLMSMILQIVVQIQVFKTEEEENILYFFKQFTFYYTMIFDCIFIIPVTLLFTFQIYNIIKGQTTYERYLEKQGVNRVQSRKASAEQQLKSLKSNSAETSDGEFKLTLKQQKKPLLQETELIV